jgi:hypothetical protein
VTAVPGVPADVAAAFTREWARLAAPGTWWAGRQRVEIAAVARAARSGERAEAGHLPCAAVEAAALLGARPGDARKEWVQGITRELGDPPYVELVGIVARSAAVDAFHRAAGIGLPELPAPQPGVPARAPEPALRTGPAWVPMPLGSIVNALALVPAEAAAQEDLHGPLYLTYEGMADPAVRRAIDRAQMEVVAARTSAVNECFY